MRIEGALKNRQVTKCQKCGGQLIHCHGEVGCFQCGAVHTMDGGLETINPKMDIIITEEIRGAPEPGENHILIPAQG